MFDHVIQCDQRALRDHVGSIRGVPLDQRNGATRPMLDHPLLTNFISVEVSSRQTVRKPDEEIPITTPLIQYGALPLQQGAQACETKGIPDAF